MQSFRYLALAGAFALSGASAYAIHVSQQTRDTLVALQGQAERDSPAVPDGGTLDSDSLDLAARLGLLELQFREARSAPTAPATGAGELAELRQAVDALQRSLAAMSAGDDVGDAAALELDLAGQAEELDLAALEASYDQEDRLAYIGEVFAAEPEDVEWTRATTSQVHDYFSGVADDGIDLRHLDCRSSLCEMEAVISSDEAMARFDLEFTMEMAAVLPSAVFSQTVDDDGSIRVRAFLARDGESLPSAGEPTR